MNLRSVNRAIARYQAATTPAAVREAIRSAKGRPYRKLVTAAGIRAGAADVLREVLEREIAR